MDDSQYVHTLLVGGRPRPDEKSCLRHDVGGMVLPCVWCGEPLKADETSGQCASCQEWIDQLYDEDLAPCA